MGVRYDETKFTELLVHVVERVKDDRAGGATKLASPSPVDMWSLGSAGPWAAEITAYSSDSDHWDLIEDEPDG